MQINRRKFLASIAGSVPIFGSVREKEPVEIGVYLSQKGVEHANTLDVMSLCGAVEEEFRDISPNRETNVGLAGVVNVPETEKKTSLATCRWWYSNCPREYEHSNVLLLSNEVCEWEYAGRGYLEECVSVANPLGSLETAWSKEAVFHEIAHNSGLEHEDDGGTLPSGGVGGDWYTEEQRNEIRDFL